MEGVEKVANLRLNALEESIQEINWDRKTEQERIGKNVSLILHGPCLGDDLNACVPVGIGDLLPHPLA